MSNRAEAFYIGTLKIQARGKKQTYSASFQFDGAHRRQSLHTTNRKEAQRRAIKLASELEQGKFAIRDPDHLIEECRQQFIAFKRDEGRAVKTIGRYSQVLRDFVNFLSGLGVRKMNQIKMAHLDMYRNHLRTKPKRKL